MNDAPKVAVGGDAVVTVTGYLYATDGPPHAYIEGSRTTIPASALRPLPSALTAEDEAVLRAADEFDRMHSLHNLKLDSGAVINNALNLMRATHELLAAIRSRRHPTPPAGEPAQDSAAPTIAALERAALDALMKANKLRREWIQTSQAKDFHKFEESRGKAWDAADALLAALAPPDPAREAIESLRELVDQNDNGLCGVSESCWARARSRLSALGDRGRG